MEENHRIGGFTLVELSLVLVIIGLIVGAIIIGQEMIRQSQLRSVMREADSFKSTVNAFRLKYNAIPGDALHASDWFGLKADYSDGTAFIGTCNGNGNSKINQSASTTTAGNEMFLFWQQLAASGMISDNFNGVEGILSSGHVVPGTNAPHSRIPGATWTAIYYDYSTLVSPQTYFKINADNFLYVGIAFTTGTGGIGTAITTPVETHNLDVKMDDGKPGMGKVIVHYWSTYGSTTHTSASCTNATSDSDFGAGYNLTNTEISCIPKFINAF